MTHRFEIPLSTPHLGGEERRYLDEAFASNWIAPLGPQVDAFEEEFRASVGAGAALALSSGTAGLHLALRLADVGPGDEVLVSTLTFVASVNPIRYLGATPVFVDSETTSWNIDPALVAEVVRTKVRLGRRPKAVIVVHLYGQSADLDPIMAVCAEFGIPVIEDAAESLGSTYRSRWSGTLGWVGVYTINGNKTITTSGGGMLVANDPGLVARARHLASQAREPAPHYEHSEVGYNYRLSNLLAAVGRGQLEVLESRVSARRANFSRYVAALGDLPGVEFMPEAAWGRHTRWLTTLTIDPIAFGHDRESVRCALAQTGIEARPLWKPMHLQSLYAGCEVAGGAVAERLFAQGLCLPSGSNLAPAVIDQVATAFRWLSRGQRFP